jgi:hypothetical protein
MRLIKILFLILVFPFTAALTYPCYWFCTEQTSLQRDYVSSRDECRDYAQNKLEQLNDGTLDDVGRKSRLVSLFSDCMARNGWTVPDGRGDKGDKPQGPLGEKKPAAGIQPVVEAPSPPSTTPAKKPRPPRALECALARHATHESTNAAGIAKDCDQECAVLRQQFPNGPRPAACPRPLR